MFLKTKNFQIVLRLHRWLGVFLSLHLLILALTGAILVFREEIEPGPAILPPVSEPIPLHALVAQSLRQHPSDRVLAIAVDHDDEQRVTLRLGKDGSPQFRGARRLTYDRRDGRLQTESGADDSLMTKLLILHRELFLGTVGKLYVGVLGLLYAFVLVFGLILYGPLMKRLSFGTLRSHLNPRLWWSDLHKYFGAMTFAWSLVIALTGFLLGWGGPIIKLYQASALTGLNSEFAGPQDQRPLVTVDEALQAAQTAMPEGQFSFVSYPGSEFSTAHHYIFVMDGSTPLTEKLSNLVVVNASSGLVDRVLHLPWYLQLFVLAEPLHFGDYGGMPMKWLWVIFSLFSLVLPLSGLFIFVDKYRKKARSQANGRSRNQRYLSPSQRPYLRPLLVMILSWTGLIVALGVEGGGDRVANACLATAIMLSFWYLRKSHRSIPSE